MSFRNKTDMQTGAETLGSVASIKGLQYEADEISIAEGLNTYNIIVYETSTRDDLELPKTNIANMNYICGVYAIGTPFELGQIDISEEGRGYVRAQDISATYELDWTLETSVNRLATVTNNDDDIIGCCFLELVETEDPASPVNP